MGNLSIDYNDPNPNTEHVEENANSIIIGDTLIQWGIYSASVPAETMVVLDKSFANSNYAMCITIEGDESTSMGSTQVYDKEVNSCYVRSQNFGGFDGLFQHSWMAIGEKA